MSDRPRARTRAVWRRGEDENGERGRAHFGDARP